MLQCKFCITCESSVTTKYSDRRHSEIIGIMFVLQKNFRLVEFFDIFVIITSDAVMKRLEAEGELLLTPPC